LVAGRGGGSGLPAYTVRSLLRRREAALQRCYDGLLLRAPGTASGNLTVRLRILPSGDVEELDLVGGTLDDDEFERCVLDQLRRVDFPAADTPTVYTHSFSFAAAGGAAPLTE
ncbi:MAG: AgmX/PglI C-terminal domain-containing protein, partial [Deltaproteobacteria bacterium]|nr:AgmX/PglI C-terminal domain-containing protein [Deltaproteobacteria bacterium]